jgi:glutamate/tyrosine decarboxylase-like PLP-dependent enzyme
MTDPALYPCFLGPYAENDDLLESLVVGFLRDHAYWRRNLHPEDAPAIPTGANRRPDYIAFESRMRRELHALSAALKRSVPFHSPRYIGHMVSDLLIPGLAAQMLALPYNPNNVTAEAAPVTIDLELKVGLQLATMIGFVADPARADCAFGHLISGGTLANVQGLRLALAMKAFPVALRSAAAPIDGLPDDDWQAFNLAHADTIALLDRWRAALAAMPQHERARWRSRVEAERLEALGLHDFILRHPALKPPVVFAPSTAHYSWSKGMKLLGLGRDRLRLIPGRAMRLDIDALQTGLDDCLRQRQPVLMTVGVLGSTEFGTIDPVDGIVAVRRRMQPQGLDFAIHVDAAWGGYLCTLFRDEDNRLRAVDDIGREFTQFPTPAVHAAVAALADVDSVTIDPHKLGYLPYGSGAFVCRDQRAVELLTESADYVFCDDGATDFFARHRQIGRYVPEGSKPGANAAAVYVTHRTLPLDHAHFGRLQAQSISGTEAFVAEAGAFVARNAGRLRACVPFAPDSNLVCLAINPLGNRDPLRMNAFVRTLHRRLSADPGKPLQLGEYFGSITTLKPESLGAEETRRILEHLGFADDALRPGEEEADRMVVLRHTLMHPFLLDDGNGRSYLAGYFEFLDRLLTALLDERIPERPAEEAGA